MRCALAVLALAACAPETLHDLKRPAPAAPTAERAQSPAPHATAESLSRVPPSPKADMSLQLGGLRLGMTTDDFMTTCRGGRGAFVRVDETNLACTLAPSPLAVAGRIGVDLHGAVAGKFCPADGPLCELAYVFDGDDLHRDGQVEALMEMLGEKYGPHSDSEGYAGNDPMARCQIDRAVRWKRRWVFSPKQTPPHRLGWVRLVFECDLRGAERSHRLTVFLDDESGGLPQGRDGP